MMSVPMIRTMRRFACVVAGAVALAMPAGAQQAPTALKGIEVDRIVGVVGTHPILFSEVLEAINFARAGGMQLPEDSTGQIRVAREFLGRIVDKEVLITVATDYKIEVTESDVSSSVERDLERARGQFRSDAEFRTALQREGFGTPEEYRKKAVESAIRDEQQRLPEHEAQAVGVRLACGNHRADIGLGRGEGHQHGATRHAADTVPTLFSAAGSGWRCPSAHRPFSVFRRSSR
jgi:hypothetical protein